MVFGGGSGARRRERILPYLQRLYGYARYLTMDPGRAEDLVQETCIRALASKRQPADDPAYRAWLFRILRNLHIDEGRRASRRQAVEVDIGTVDEVAMEYSSTPDRLTDELDVRAAMARLRPDHAEILAMVDVGGLSYREAADVLDVPVGTVMSRVSRARAALLAALEHGDGKVVSLAQRRKSRGHS